MVKKVLCVFLAVVLLALSVTGMYVSAQSQADAATSFTFENGEMSKEVLRSYVSRAVTHQGFCVQKNGNKIFEEDLRFLRRIGAKYIGRTAMLSWVGNMTAEEIENHFKIAKENAAKAHMADSEMILQAGIFEIAYKGTVNNIKIPDYVFEAFGEKKEKRNFSWEKVVYPEGAKTITGRDIGIGCWGNKDSGTPDIKQLEAQMYFYYMITRYIDAGYEAFHMGQAELMMGYDAQYSNCWQTLLDKARAYAKTNARRGLALFDCHTAIDSSGIKVGDKLIFDIQGAGMCPNETVYENGAMKAELLHYKELSPERDDALSWVGRSSGGIHPLGFEIEENFTLIEFDNYGGNGAYGIATQKAFYNWGFDDVTWFAVQPEWYRNEFLKQTAEYLSNSKVCLDSNGKQQYFLQPVTSRQITPGESKWYPEVKYTLTENSNEDFVFDFLESDGTKISIGDDGIITVSVKNQYRANNNSDGCPSGFNQEDTIREIFLGKNAPENPELQKIVLPIEYTNAGTVTTPSITDPVASDTEAEAEVITVKISPIGTAGTVIIWVIAAVAVLSLTGAAVFTVYVIRFGKKNSQ